MSFKILLAFLVFTGYNLATNNFSLNSLTIKNRTTVETTKIGHYLLGVFVIINILLLLITIIIYGSISKLRNYRGVLIISYVSCIAVNVLHRAANFLDINGLWSNQEFFFIYITQAEYCWSNVICFDTWKNFRRLKMTRVQDNKSDTVKFILYAVYAWIGSFIILFNCEFFGKSTCAERMENYILFETRTQVHISVPIALMTSINTFFFISTTLRIHYERKKIATEINEMEKQTLGGTDKVPGTGRTPGRQRNRSIYWRLMLTMGFHNWVLIILQVLANYIASEETETLFILRITIFTIGLAQGIITFYVFIWNEKVKQLVLEKFQNK